MKSSYFVRDAHLPTRSKYLYMRRIFRIMKGRVLILVGRKGEGAGGRWGYQALS